MSSAFQMDIPASSANLGPGFDTAALALNLYLRVAADPAAAFSITASGRDADLCRQLEPNLILATYRNLAGPESPALALRLENQIPIGKGCGSSAAARLAGAALAARFGRRRWTAQQIFNTVAQLEGHADNAAAAWWGGVVLAGEVAGGVTWQALPLPHRWPLMLVVPPLALSTEHARAALPAQYSRADVVATLHGAMQLTSALVSGRGDWLHAASRDRVHQPYRAKLCPLLPAMQSLVGQHGILAATLSGAGPSVLLWLERESREVEVAVSAGLDGAGLVAELLPVAITTLGPGLVWKP